MKTKLLKKLRKEARKYVKFELDKINYIRDSYNIHSYVGRFYYIYYDESNYPRKQPYLQDTCLEIYTESELKRTKQKLIEKDKSPKMQEIRRANQDRFLKRMAIKYITSTQGAVIKLNDCYFIDYLSFL